MSISSHDNTILVAFRDYTQNHTPLAVWSEADLWVEDMTVTLYGPGERAMKDAIYAGHPEYAHHAIKVLDRLGRLS